MKKTYAAVSYDNLPELSTIGLQPLYTVSDNFLFELKNNGHHPVEDNSNKLYVEANFRRVGRIAGGVEVDHSYHQWEFPNSAKLGVSTGVCYDLESFWVEGADLSKPQSTRKKILSDLAYYISTTKAEQKYYSKNTVDIGCFQYPPAVISGNLVDGKTRMISELEFQNDIQPLVKQVNSFFPECYSRSQPFNEWSTNVQTQINILRTYANYPIYGFITPVEVGEPNVYKKMDLNYWNQQKEFLLKQADGYVIWGGFDLNPATNNNGTVKFNYNDWIDYIKA